MHTYDHAKNLSHYVWASTGGRMIKGKGFQQTYVMVLAQKYPEYPRGSRKVSGSLRIQLTWT
ncbi:MAG: hypothetical protein KVP17_004724 [Porospora cf. gigantea B]|uniref:uncharacterized protein n=1 Tax=Porospora cf. gigantea B TaxID=2853592 RepID=UPI003571A540|nr:MAG: hypothetical protein KVP17_004724 [Porospora cf. gigantea B]